MQNLKSQFSSSDEEGSCLKIIMTSRPYDQILVEFQPLLLQFPHVHIPGEEESQTISQEVNHVIRFRVSQLAQEKYLSQQIRSVLEEKLLGIQHRTYLWVHLVFDYLRVKTLKKTKMGIEAAIATLPQTVNSAYESILARSENGQDARRILAVILAAERPLTLSEMNVIVNISCDAEHPGSIDDLDLEDESDFKSRRRSLCSLFITIFERLSHPLDGPRVLLRSDAPQSLPLASTTAPALPPPMPVRTWQHSITVQESHVIFAEICILYLNCLNTRIVSSLKTDARISLLEYASNFWAAHFRHANVSSDNPLASIAVDMCNSDKDH
jgi:hypothetical protein